MGFNPKQIKIARRLSYGAELFQSYFFRDPFFHEQFDDGYKALICFVENYAYQRQGAAPAYPKIAKKAIENRFNHNVRLVTIVDAKEVWKDYQNIAKDEFNDLRVNKTHNPMFSDDGILAVMARENIINFASHVKGLIQNNQTKEVHELVETIRGIGTKIASLYLRDITYLGKIPEERLIDQHYLQPVDTWIEQTLSIIFGKNKPILLRDKQEIIVDLCKAANISPIAFSQGAWVLGSEVSGDFSTFQRIAKGENAKSIIKKYLEEEKEYVSKVERFLNDWPEV